MKKITFLLLLFCLGFGLMAQENSIPKVAIGVRAGLNGSSILVNKNTLSFDKGYSSTQKLKLGAQAGFTVNFRFKEKWTFQTGLIYAWQRTGQEQSSKFVKDLSSYSIGSTNAYTSHHLRLPVMINYHINTNPNHLIIGLGLYADGTLGGTLAYDASAIVTTATEQGTEINNFFASGELHPYKNERHRLYYTENKDDFVKTYDLYTGQMLKRFDIGLNLEIGYQISQFYVGIGGNIGLLNMARKEFFGNQFAERNFSLQLNFGYTIN